MDGIHKTQPGVLIIEDGRIQSIDVYKRQGFEHFVRNGMELLIAVTGFFLYAIVSVSYTHLDVYKRQVLM